MTFDGRAAGTEPERWDRGLAGLDAARLPASGRTVVVAAHPDDETLGAGGLIAELAAAGRPAEVVVVTDGAGSHPGSGTVTPAALVTQRADEVRAAVSLLSPGSTVTLLGRPDGQVRELRDAVADDLRAVLTAGGPVRLLVAPWRGDGHRDHRVVGEICAALADELGVALWEYPLWLWHWATPDDERVPWAQLRALPLGDRSVVLKHRAVAAHTSQVQALSSAPEDAPQLHPQFLRTFDRDAEPFVVTEPVTATTPAGELGQQYFDATYDRHDDPWGFTHRWYERRKRAVTTSALPDERYARALEVGCSIGVLTAELAERCDDLLAIDLAPAAVERARDRLAGRDHVRVEVGDVADRAPAGPFDLIVVSEVGYYLTLAHLRDVLSRLEAELAPGGTLVACHWRHPVADYPLTGDQVHRTLARGTALTRVVAHEEADFLLDVYSADARSVAARTGLQ